MCTYLNLSLCGVMDGRKRRGRPGIFPAIFVFFLHPMKGHLQFFSTFFSATKFPHFCYFFQPYPVDPYSAMCTYLHLSLCGVMDGRKRRGRPGIFPAIFCFFSPSHICFFSPYHICFFSPSHEGSPTIFLHVFFGHRISTFLLFFLFCRLP